MNKHADIPVFGRNLLIDALRGISIMMVLVTHLGLPQWVGDHLPPILLEFLGHGYYGVSIFFVVSGFLIATHSLKRYGELKYINIFEFYSMRLARIMPCLLLVLLVLMLADAWQLKGYTFPADLTTWQAAKAALIFRFNYFYIFHNAHEIRAWAPMWSLSVEEMFYLVFPFICFFIRNQKLLIGTLLLIIIAGLIFRTEPVLLYTIKGCFDLMALGILTAIVSQHTQLKVFLAQRTYLAILFLMAGLSTIFAVVSFKHVDFNYGWGPSICGFGAAIFLLGAAHCQIGITRRKPIISAIVMLLMPLMLIGQLSYEIYLLHMPVQVLLENHFVSWISNPRSVAITLILSFLLAKLYAEPLNHYIRKFCKNIWIKFPVILQQLIQHPLAIPFLKWVPAWNVIKNCIPQNKPSIKNVTIPKNSVVIRVLQRNLLIDILRGVAIIMVMASHWITSETLDKWVPAPLNLLFEHGYYGVSIFFVISGFLIASHSLQRYGALKHINIFEFYSMRIARIIPCLALLIGGLFLADKYQIVGFTFTKDVTSWQAVQAVVKLYFNYFLFGHYVPALSSWSPLWSLTIEEIFYIIFPFFCLIIRNQKLLCLSLLLIVLTGPLRRFDDGTLYTAQGCFDLMALGILTAICVHAKIFDKWLAQPLRYKLGIFIGAAITFSVAIYTHVAFNRSLGPSICGLGTVIYLLCASHWRLNPKHTNTVNKTVMLVLFPLILFGQLSYELYLFHVSVKNVFKNYWPEFDRLEYLLAVTFIISFLIAKFYAEPLNQLIRKVSHIGLAWFDKLLVWITRYTLFGAIIMQLKSRSIFQPKFIIPKIWHYLKITAIERPYIWPTLAVTSLLFVAALSIGDWNVHGYFVYYSRHYLRSFALPEFIHNTDFIGMLQPLVYGVLFYPTTALIGLIFGGDYGLRIIVLLSTLLTAGLAYYLFKQLTRSRLLGFLFCSLVVCTQYAFSNLYPRGAIAEYVAINLIYAGIFCLALSIAKISATANRWWLNWGCLLLALAFGTHPISLILTCFVLAIALPFLLFLLKANDQKILNWLWQLAPFAILTMLSNIAFLYAAQTLQHEFQITEYLQHITNFNVIPHISDLMPKFLPLAGDYRTYAEGIGQTSTAYLKAALEFFCLPLMGYLVFGILKNSSFKKTAVYLLSAGFLAGAGILLAVIECKTELQYYLPHLVLAAQYAYRLTNYENMFLFMSLIVLAFAVYKYPVPFTSKSHWACIIILTTLVFAQTYLRITEIIYLMHYNHIGVHFTPLDKRWQKNEIGWIPVGDYVNMNLYTKVTEAQSKAAVAVKMPVIKPRKHRSEIGFDCQAASCLVRTNALISRFLKVEVDGDIYPAENLMIDNTFLVVKLPTGSHQIRLSYTIPLILKILRIISFTTWFTWLFASLYWWAKRMWTAKQQAIS